MESFSVRELKKTDTQALLAFEVHNREWFESHIDARDPAFYSLQGIADHIESYLSDFAIGAWHPVCHRGFQSKSRGASQSEKHRLIDGFCASRLSDCSERVRAGAGHAGAEASDTGSKDALGAYATGCLCLQGKCGLKKSPRSLRIPTGTTLL